MASIEDKDFEKCNGKFAQYLPDEIDSLSIMYYCSVQEVNSGEKGCKYSGRLTWRDEQKTRECLYFNQNYKPKTI